ncbi:PRC-barrel domain-containing protein [Streptomyces tagetis]|uniref:PRC-barrel domain-containing protein n=1 Tax=Streptomyces tagetis TaxID=2820809 RepID=A0A940XI03_9ACTN|nr:PRC-barrel domain-containing protein [Streptomyces sp. RG38]MBQ0826911.1 PRC-barrel domain-containing protein [Streptomyces sp. RG38]
MMLLTEVYGLPVTGPDGRTRLGTVASLSVDAGAGTVRQVRVRRGPFRKEAAVSWDAVRSVGPDGVRLRADAAADAPRRPRDLLGSLVLTEAGRERGRVLDAAVAPETGRVLAVFTTRGELPPARLLGLGDHALVVRSG